MSKNVTKNDLVDAVYQNIDSKIEKKNIQKVVDLLLEEMKNSLTAGFSIELRGFGTLGPRLRKPKNKARNPRTGETIKIEAHYVAAFKAGQKLKEKLWNLKTENETNE